MATQRSQGNKNPVLGFRLPADLHAAITERAEQQGVTASEWIRDALFRIVYGEPLGIEQGYREGRQLGFRMMQLAFKNAHDATPDNVEEAVREIQAFARRDR